MHISETYTLTTREQPCHLALLFRLIADHHTTVTQHIMSLLLSLIVDTSSITTTLLF
jgi:hypothetical protein